MAGISDYLSQSLVWRLSSQDDAEEIEGQYIPTDVVHEVSANYAAQGSIGRDQPILQYQGDELESIEFTARVFAPHQGILGLGAANVRDLIEKIKGLARKDKDLGRPKVWDFALGEELSMVCVVKSVGGIRYDRPRPLDGSMRGATFRVVLWRYDAYDVALSGLPAESLVLPFKANESFENLARRVYGDPAVGEALRRRNPGVVVPDPGVYIHLPPKASLTVGFRRAPVSVPLAATDRQKPVRLAHFALRGGVKRSYRLNAEWTRS